MLYLFIFASPKIIHQPWLFLTKFVDVDSLYNISVFRNQLIIIAHSYFERSLKITSDPPLQVTPKIGPSGKLRTQSKCANSKVCALK